jgi:hypothetical protein
MTRKGNDRASRSSSNFEFLKFIARQSAPFCCMWQGHIYPSGTVKAGLGRFKSLAPTPQSDKYLQAINAIEWISGGVRS